MPGKMPYMSGTINTHLQDLFLEEFFSLPQAGDFYLTGGTALSRFYLFHRESVDLDLFTNNQTADFANLNFQILAIGQKLKLTIVKQVVTKTFLQYIFEDNKKSTLKVDLVRDISVHHGKIKTVEKIRLDALENIATNKILAIFGRTDAKDFIDLYFLLKNKKFTLLKLITKAKEKDLGFTEFYFANAVKQLENTHIYPEVFLPFNKTEFQKFYQNLSRDLLLQIKPKF